MDGSKRCDFWNIFRIQRGEELVTTNIWQDILNFNDLLKEFNFSKIEKTLLHDLINLTVYKNKRKFRNPDYCNASDELSKVLPRFNKGTASKTIPLHFNIPRNTSPSFKHFVSGLNRVINQYMKT